MEKTHNIATGLILMSIGLLITLSDYKNALFLTGALVAVSGLGILLNINQKTDNEN